MRSLVALINAYRYFLSPFFGRKCRFDPTCSMYARDALLHHGVLRGVWLAVSRIGRCHPWAQGGYDPVPPIEHLPRTTDTSH